MKLNNITEGTWSKISNYLNYNFNKLSIATSKLKGVILVSFKGVYMSEAELKSKYTLPNTGDYAFVLTTEGSDAYFKVYYTSYREWLTDGGVYDPEVFVAEYIETVDLEGDISRISKEKNEYNRDKD